VADAVTTLSSLRNILVYLFVRLPWWVIKYTQPWNRPRASWTLKRCLMVKTIKWLLATDIKLPGLSRKIADHRAIRAGNGVNGVWIPAAPELVVGQIKEYASAAHVEPARIPGYWMHKEGLNIAVGQKPSKDEKILYFIHGGGYVAFSAHPSDPTASIPRSLLKLCPTVTRSLSLEYRLTSGPPRGPPQGVFPSALLDAVAGYNYLLNTVGCAPENIIVVGDSAGGNITLSFIRYLIQEPLNLPVPGAILLLSPSCDMSSPRGTPEEVARHSYYSNSECDYLTSPKDPPPSTNAAMDRNWGIKCLMGPLPEEDMYTNPYLSPGSVSLPDISFKGYPKTFIVSGDAELLVDKIRVLQKRMIEQLGENVHYYESKDSVHDFLVFPWHEPERGQTFSRIAAWIARL